MRTNHFRTARTVLALVLILRAAAWAEIGTGLDLPGDKLLGANSMGLWGSRDPSQSSSRDPSLSGSDIGGLAMSQSNDLSLLLSAGMGRSAVLTPMNGEAGISWTSPVPLGNFPLTWGLHARYDWKRWNVKDLNIYEDDSAVEFSQRRAGFSLGAAPEAGPIRLGIGMYAGVQDLAMPDRSTSGMKFNWYGGSISVSPFDPDRNPRWPVLLSLLLGYDAAANFTNTGDGAAVTFAESESYVGDDKSPFRDYTLPGAINAALSIGVRPARLTFLIGMKMYSGAETVESWVKNPNYDPNDSESSPIDRFDRDYFFVNRQKDPEDLVSPAIADASIGRAIANRVRFAVQPWNGTEYTFGFQNVVFRLPKAEQRAEQFSRTNATAMYLRPDWRWGMKFTYMKSDDLKDSYLGGMERITATIGFDIPTGDTTQLGIWVQGARVRFSDINTANENDLWNWVEGNDYNLFTAIPGSQYGYAEVKLGFTITGHLFNAFPWQR